MDYSREKLQARKCLVLKKVDVLPVRACNWRYQVLYKLYFSAQVEPMRFAMIFTAHFTHECIHKEI